MKLLKPKKKKRQRGKAKAQATVTTSPKQSATSEPPKPSNSITNKLAASSVTPDKARQDDESASASMSSNESNWTLVSRKRRRPRLPPCWKLRFLVHIRDKLKTPSGTDSEDSEAEVSQSVQARMLEALNNLHPLQQELDLGRNLNLNQLKLLGMHSISFYCHHKKCYRQKLHTK